MNTPNDQHTAGQPGRSAALAAIDELMHHHTADSLEAELREMYRHMMCPRSDEPPAHQYLQDTLFTLDHLCLALRHWMGE